MKRKILALTVLSFVILTTVAPFYGASVKNETNNIEVKETTKSTPDISLGTGISNVIFDDDLLINDTITIDQLWEWRLQHTGWITGDHVPIMSEPSEKSEMIDKYMFNDYVSYTYFNEKWCKVKVFRPNINEQGIQIGMKVLDGYVDMNYVSEVCNARKTYSIPKNKGFKSYMSYTAITDKNSKQYELQKYAYTGNYGIRQVNERYCVAIGTHFGVTVGTYFDLVLENNTVIPCIVGDIKSTEHTLRDKITTARNGCVSEFLVETRYLPYKVRNCDFTGTGDISDCCQEWDSPVKEIRVYDKNVLNKEGEDILGENKYKKNSY